MDNNNLFCWGVIAIILLTVLLDGIADIIKAWKGEKKD